MNKPGKLKRADKQERTLNVSIAVVALAADSLNRASVSETFITLFLFLLRKNPLRVFR